MNFFFSILSVEILGMALALGLGLLLKYRYSLLEFLSFSFLNGLGLVAASQFLFYLLKIKTDLNVILALVICALALLIILYVKFGRQVINKHIEVKDIGLCEKLIMLGIFIQLAWVILHVLPMPVRSFDSVATFSLKAKIFYLSQGIPAGFFRLDESVVWHVDYPLLLPFYMTWVYHFIGFNDIAITRIMPVLYLVFIVLFYSLSRKFFDRRYSLICAFVLSAIPQLARFAMIMYADVIFTAFITCAFLYLMLYLTKSNQAYLVFSSLLFASSVWIKNEGIVFLPVFLLSLIFAKRKFRSIILPIAIIFLVASPWLIFRACEGLTNSDINLQLLTSEKLFKNLRDSLHLLNKLQSEIFNPKKWNLLWVIAGFVISFNIKRIFSTKAIYAVFFILIAVLFYGLSYILTVSYDMVFLSEKTLSRSMIHFCGMVIFLTAYLLYPEDKKGCLSG